MKLLFMFPHKQFRALATVPAAWMLFPFRMSEYNILWLHSTRHFYQLSWALRSSLNSVKSHQTSLWVWLDNNRKLGYMYMLLVSYIAVNNVRYNWYQLFHVSIKDVYQCVHGPQKGCRPVSCSCQTEHISIAKGLHISHWIFLYTLY